MRSVWEYNVALDTSVGRVEGVLWSDGKLAIGSPRIESVERDVHTAADIAAALRVLDIPDQEATRAAQSVYDGALDAFPERLASRFAKPS
jgi:hypothetical protein